MQVLARVRVRRELSAPVEQGTAEEKIGETLAVHRFLDCGGKVIES